MLQDSREKNKFSTGMHTQNLVVMLNLGKQRTLTLLLRKKHDVQVKPYNSYQGLNPRARTRTQPEPRMGLEPTFFFFFFF